MSRRFVFLSESMCLQGKYKYEENINTFFTWQSSTAPDILQSWQYWNRMQLPLENLTWNYGENIAVREEFETALYDLTVWFPEKTWNVERKWFSFSQGYSYTYFIQTPDHTCLWCKIANNAGICTCLISQQEDNKFPSYPRRGFCSMLVFYSN